MSTEKQQAARERREEYYNRVLGEETSLISGDPAEQKAKLSGEAARLARLAAEDSSSVAVTGDCNTLLDEARTLLAEASPNPDAVLGKLEKVKQRLIRAYDSREAQPPWFKLISYYNLLLLAAFVAIIACYKLIPGQANLANTAYVCLACAIWGGVGGIADAFFALHRHLADQDFDKQYWPWYYFHPILGLSMGAVVYLLVQAGLLATSGTVLQEAGASATAASKIGVTALPIVLAFLAGFRQRTAVDFLTRIIASIFQKSSGSNTG